MEVWVGGQVTPATSLRCRWFHPWAPGRGMVSRFFPAQERARRIVRAEGLEPSRAVKLNGFSYRLRLSPPGRGVSERARQVCGLDYPFTVPRKYPGLRCCPSSLYTFPAGIFRPGLARDCHPRLRGDKFEVSPNLGSSASPVSQASTQVCLSPLRLPVPPHPRGWSFRAFITWGSGM